MQTDRQTGRQTDRQTGRRADRQTDRQTDRNWDLLDKTLYQSPDELSRSGNGDIGSSEPAPIHPLTTHTHTHTHTHIHLNCPCPPQQAVCG